DPRHTLQPVSKTSLPRTRHRRPDEPVTLRAPDRAALRQTARGHPSHPAALELEHKQASELQRPIFHIRSEERRVGKECRYTRSKRDWSSDVCSSDLRPSPHSPTSFQNVSSSDSAQATR